MKNSFQAKNIFKIKNLEEYTYLAIFFIICSFFIIFVIRPNLKQIFIAKQKLDDLRLINDDYEKVINKIIEFQAGFEQYRDNYHLIDQAVPPRPFINRILVDINDLVNKNNLQVEKIAISDVNLITGKKEHEETVKIDLSLIGGFDNFNQFIKNIANQRRIKMIESFEIKNSNELFATESSQLKINIIINSYFQD